MVVTNNYRAGGGKFPGLDGSNIIVEALNELARPRCLPVIPQSPCAIPEGSRISYLRNGGNGFGKYRINLTK